MTRMTGPDCVVMCNLINTHTHTHTHTVDRVNELYLREADDRRPPNVQGTSKRDDV